MVRVSLKIWPLFIEQASYGHNAYKANCSMEKFADELNPVFRFVSHSLPYLVNED